MNRATKRLLYSYYYDIYYPDPDNYVDKNRILERKISSSHDTA